MARPVGHEADQRAAGQPRGERWGGSVDEVGNGGHHVEIATLRLAADQIGLAGPPARHDLDERRRVIFDVEPVAHVLAAPVDRQRLAAQRLDDHQRDELFGEVVGPVIVGAIAHQHRQAERVAPRPHQMVGSRLAGRVGRARIVRGRLGKGRVARAEGAEHFVRRNMVEAECGLGGLVELGEVGARDLQQPQRADHVGLNEILRPVYGPVDMALGGEVHHRIGPEVAERPRERRPVANVDGAQGIARIGRDAGKRIHRRRIGELVDDEDRVIRVGDEPARHGAADETRPAGQKDAHVGPCAMNPAVLRTGSRSRRAEAASDPSPTIPDPFPASGQSIARSGSSQTIPASCAGE